MKRSFFVDLFYAVVIGSAFPQINLDEPIINTLYRVFLISVILEDWYMYYYYVLPSASIEKSMEYSAASLITEFSILLVWYLSILSVPDHILILAVSFVLFYLIKFFAGIAYYKSTKLIIRDLAFLIPILSLSVFCLNLTLNILFFFQFSSWLVYLIVWWRLLKDCK